RHHLPEEPEGEKLDATQDQKHRDKQERPVFEHDGLMQEEFFIEKVNSGDGPGTCAEEAQRPEEAQGLRGVVQQELNADQVQQHSNGSGKAVMRRAVLTKRIPDRNLGDGRSRPACQSRNEAMQFAIELKVSDYFPPIGFEGG